MAEALRANISSKLTISLQQGRLYPKFQVKGVAPTDYSSSQKNKTRLNYLSYGIKIWTDLSSVLSQCMRLTDRQTDSFLVTRPPCIQCSTVKSTVESFVLCCTQDVPVRCLVKDKI